MHRGSARGCQEASRRSTRLAVRQAAPVVDTHWKQMIVVGQCWSVTPGHLFESTADRLSGSAAQNSRSAGRPRQDSNLRRTLFFGIGALTCGERGRTLAGQGKIDLHGYPTRTDRLRTNLVSVLHDVARRKDHEMTTAKRETRRSYGAVRELPSGRFQASHVAPRRAAHHAAVHLRHQRRRRRLAGGASARTSLAASGERRTPRQSTHVRRLPK